MKPKEVRFCPVEYREAVKAESVLVLKAIAVAVGNDNINGAMVTPGTRVSDFFFILNEEDELVELDEKETCDKISKILGVPVEANDPIVCVARRKVNNDNN